MFAARYPGKCWGCDTPFLAGELIKMVASEHQVNGVPVAQCCADDLTDEDKERELFKDQPIPPDLVLPRGKTVKDRCGQCFQIPASSGVCGCDA